VTSPDVPGTVFTIVFENENAANVLTPSAPYFVELAARYGNAEAYTSNTHPSLVNYIMMTSGTTGGITTNDDPATNKTIDGTAHLAEQLDAARVPWRAYMESMGEPCRLASEEPYGARHNPFVYYTSLTSDAARCRDRVVDFDAHFTEDLAADRYRYMWITPNNCNNMHDCPVQTADAWLRRVMGQIMESPGYKRGGVVFVLFDEGRLRIFNAGANVVGIVVSPQLVAPGMSSQTAFDHRSYLATVEDIFGMPRLATTIDATPMSEFLRSKDPAKAR
jgi:hypothetical protein